LVLAGLIYIFGLLARVEKQGSSPPPAVDNHVDKLKIKKKAVDKLGRQKKRCALMAVIPRKKSG